MDRARTGVLAIGMATLALCSCSRTLHASEPQTRSDSKPPERTATGVPDTSVVLRPRQLEHAIKRCTVPNLIGLNLKAAGATLQKTGLALGDVGRRADSRPAGAIISQSEKPDSQVPCGSQVNIVTASVDEPPRPDCAVPKLTGDDEQLAKR